MPLPRPPGAAPRAGPRPCWLREEDGAIVLALHVQPGAKRTGAAGEHGGALRIRLAAPPVDGKANAELLRFLAETCGVATSAVELIAGTSGRDKRLRIRAPKQLPPPLPARPVLRATTHS